MGNFEGEMCVYSANIEPVCTQRPLPTYHLGAPVGHRSPSQDARKPAELTDEKYVWKGRGKHLAFKDILSLVGM